MNTPEGFHRCITPRCRNDIADRYGFKICTACVAKGLAHDRLVAELEADKRRAVVAKAASRRMKQLRRELQKERGIGHAKRESRSDTAV